jgi:hypothetical protein
VWAASACAGEPWPVSPISRVVVGRCPRFPVNTGWRLGLCLPTPSTSRVGSASPSRARPGARPGSRRSDP